MANNNVTVFDREMNENIYPLFDPIRVLSKQMSVESGAKTVSIPTAGLLNYDDDIRIDSASYPASASINQSTEKTFDLTNHEFVPIMIRDYDEFITKPSLRASIMNDVMGFLGAYAIRTIFGGFWSTAATFEVGTTGTTSGEAYTNQWGDAVKNLTLADVRGLAKKLDLQNVPRDNDRYLALPPEMYSGLMANLTAAGYVETVTEAFRSGLMPKVHGFNVMMLPEVGVSTTGNAVLRTPKTQGGAGTDVNFGFALHKKFVGFAESGVRLFINENATGYYGATIEGSIYAGGSFLRATPIGCITVFEAAA